MKEIWKDIPGTDGQYQISNLGNARSTFYHTCKWKRNYRIKLLKQKPNPYGYLHVSILLNKKRVSKFIHRMVAMLFVPNPKNKPEVNHLDGNKKNNAASNLKWVTSSENVKHAFATGLNRSWAKGIKGTEHPASKNVAQYDLEGNVVGLWGSVYDAGLYWNLNPKSIAHCASGFSKSYGGYMWKYCKFEDFSFENIAPYENNTGKWQTANNPHIKAAQEAVKRPVLQYDLKGNFVKKWESIISVARHFCCSAWLIRYRCTGHKNREAFGYFWYYEDEHI